MGRLVGIGNLVQAVVLGVLANWAGARWGLAGGIAWAMCAVQVATGVALLATGRRRLAFGGALLTLLGDAVLFGLFLQAGWHVATRFGADATAHGQTALTIIVAASPWLFAFPLWQLLASWPRRAPKGLPPGVAGLLLAGALLPLGNRALADRPAATWPAQPALLEASEAAFARWQGQEAALPEGSGPATVLLTPWVDGKALEGRRGDGASLAEALEQALSRLPPPTVKGERRALVLDVARTAWRSGLGSAGGSGGLGQESGRSPTVLWRPKGVRHERVLPEWSLPVARLPRGMQRVEFDSALATSEGAVPLVRAWPAAPELSADAALQAAVDGGDMILRNMTGDRYAYIIKGPSGTRGGGYNFPRHAGVTWYLARLYLRTGEDRFLEGAQRGLRFMGENTGRLADGRAYVADPKRKDGKVWVGTTSLAVLGAAELDHELAGPWGAFLASSIDEDGAVRGELDLATETFPEQQMNPYGQGQTVLALAVLVRKGHEELRPALERAARYLDGGYAPGGAGRLVVLDEHWTCIAAQAVADVMDTPHGAGVCRGYLAEQAGRTPSEHSSLRPNTGAAGGLAEAVVSGAVVLESEALRQQALAYGQHFLDAAYRPADAPFLVQPAALMGGFRSSHTDLDVQMDAVQHVGCALLGVEALLRGEAEPGAYP